MYVVKFDVTEDAFARLSRQRPFAKPRLPVCEYFSGSLRYRLRMANFRGRKSSVAENEWVTADMFWPDSVYVTFNDVAMETRRKQHFSKDQPLELTHHLAVGQNILKVIVPASVATRKSGNYFMAVEVIETLSHSEVVDSVKRQGYIGPEVTKGLIQRRLAGTQDDDDIAVSADELSIDLADPFSKALFDIPVRGESCRHLECFDLEIWLQSRPRKPECVHGLAGLRECSSCQELRGPGGVEPTLADKWKCPICSGDARPCSLRIDGFMVQVREELGRAGIKNCRSIAVGSDGAWKPKLVEPDSDDEIDDATPAPVSAAPAAQTAKIPTKAPIVILLDDD